MEFATVTSAASSGLSMYVPVNWKLVTADKAWAPVGIVVTLSDGWPVALGWLVAVAVGVLGGAEVPELLPQAPRANAVTANRTSMPRLWLWNDRSIQTSPCP